MKSTVVHNPTAGRGKLSAGELLEAIRRAGFEPMYYSTKEGDYERALQDPGAVVFAVGGDGTAVKVARALRGSKVPMTIVPVGTANNIAAAFGVPENPEEAIATATLGVATPLDLGVIRSNWGNRIFVEGVGFGLFPRTIASIADWHHDLKGLMQTAEEEMCRDVEHWLDVLPGVEGRDYVIDVDGADLSGRYIMVEAMNIPTLGPTLKFADRADPSDGELDLVLAQPEDRERLAHFLSDRLRGRASRWDREVHRGRRIRVRWNDAVPRLDDELWYPDAACRERGGENALTLTVETGATLVMAPRVPDPRRLSDTVRRER